MKQMIVLVIFMMVISNQSFLISETCSCSEVIIKEDCLRNYKCSWISNVCQDQTKNIIRKGYCPQVTIDQCNQIQGCALIDNHCTFFTGCASYKQNTNEGCQTISAQCISDGKKCVSLGECSIYLTSFSCKKNYINGKFKNYCHWEPKTSICRLAQNCEELPKGLSSDLECRQQINTCTARASGGCIQSGKECSDQLLEFQCVSNLNQTVQCYWDGKLCKDKLCTSASLTYTTDSQCKDFIDICTTKKGGGCTNRLSCSDSKIPASCVTNNQGGQCIWLIDKCVDRICQNGNLNMKTNEQCQTILSTCITKFGGGCIDNGQCSDASNIQGCNIDIYGNKCYWTGYECLLKTCDVAPLEIVSDIVCEQFMTGCILSPSGQGCILNNCNAIEIQSKCTIDILGNNCVWRPNCDINTCSNAPISKFYNSHTECTLYNNICTVNDNFKGCIEKKFNCSEYKEYQCYYTYEGNGCIWLNQECVDRNCDNAPLTMKTHKECYNYLNTCTVNTNLQGCMKLKINCNQYELNEQCSIIQNSNECQWSNNQCYQKSCDIAPTTSSYNTIQKCSDYLSICTTQDRINSQGCINIGTECQQLQQKQCTYLLDGTQCFWNQQINQCEIKNCSHFLETSDNKVTYANCNAWLKKCTRGPGYNPTKCVDKPQSCLDVNITELQCIEDINGVQCAWLFGLCKIKQCGDYPYQATRSNCETWMSKCTIGTENKCIDKGSCADFGQIQEKCTSDVNGKSCAWYAATCNDKTCDNPPGPYTHINCQSWLSSCTVKPGDDGCQTKQINCNDYTAENQCQLNLLGNPCEWHTSTCILKTCSTITITISNNSHETCQTYLQNCTINNDKDGCQIKQQSCSNYGIIENCHINLSGGKCFWDGIRCVDLTCQNASIDENFDSDSECKALLPNCMVANEGGCENKKQCSQYILQSKCLTSINGIQCYWNSLNKCVDNICSNAELTNINHQNCQLFSKQCTSKIDESGGCEILKSDCTEYLGQSQCYLNISGIQCIWDQISCRQQECSDAKNISDFNYDSHQKCYDYLLNNSCTINSLSNGCIIQMELCQDYLYETQCYITKNKQLCHWYQNQCLPKYCSDTHQTELTLTECQSYLSGCQNSKNKCRIQVCEDFYYQTDLQCKNAYSKCTTNGINCILRGTCEQITAQAGCIVDSQGRFCGWSSYYSKCEYLKCETAPISLVTEQQCETYFPGSLCTTKLGGGCTKKTECQNALIQEACTTSMDDQQCFWTGSECRLPVCSDYFGATVDECQKQKSECTSDGKQCRNLINCISSLNEQSCFIGIEGVCFWFNGLCRPYSSCESVPLTTNSECLTTLGTCVSNGSVCISQRICSEYQSLFECKIGLDGQCAWLQQSTECVLFRSCYDYIGTTNEDCFNYSNNCTSDGTKCIALNKCSLYANSIGCHINQDGQQTNSQGLITSTGKCIWSDLTKTCQDIDCDRLVGLIHESCYNQLSSCTSNGEKCIKIQKCEKYDVSYCSKAQGTDGICYLEESICKPLSCSKYNQSICESNNFCYYNGTECQQLMDCKDYETQSTCTYGNDGACIWNGVSCHLFSNCSDANNNQNKCRDYKNKCYWTSASDSNVSECSPHTCQTIFQIGPCQNIYSFDEKTITLCTLLNSKCIELKPETLIIDNCYDASLGLYRWNGTNCQTCQIITTPNITETNNTQSSVGSYLLSITILYGILLYL